MVQCFGKVGTTNGTDMIDNRIERIIIDGGDVNVGEVMDCVEEVD